MAVLKKKGGALAKLRGQKLKRSRVDELVKNKKEALVLAIDVSLSMAAPADGLDLGYDREPSRLRAAKDAARELIRASLLSNVALISFSERYDLVADFGDATTDALEHLHVQRGTLMNEALVGIEDLLTLRSEPVLRGILLSDGTDYHGEPAWNIPRQYRNEALDLPVRLKRQGIIVDCIGFGEDADEERLTQIAEATGGVYRHAKDAASLRREFLRLEVGARGLLTDGSK